ncbi:stage III sporulation protein AF [Paraliobacillus salinarum]|uniref:stage III sporulation protein AF n=1 Tax=Paraliobacillus salinarum TaxID=1158996 RepID=UPI0015F59659|nr:stage III sporulation protein AF [Paraliobacillus salinarum]
MDYFITWITRLVLFLFLVLIVEMLLPQTMMRKYVHIVLSFLFLLMFLHPLFQLFNVDINQAISRSMDTFEQSLNNNQLKNEIENKKKEIQASQDAYVEEELIVQMINQVKEGLIEKYDMEISSVQFRSEENIGAETLEEASIYVEVQENVTKREVKEVIIGNDQVPKKDTEDETLRNVSIYLAEQWEVKLEQLNVVKKGEKNE